jgi:hypothetical protein
MNNDIRVGSLIVDSHHGVYCPQVFAELIDRTAFPGIAKDAWEILEAGPDHEDYWHVWCYEVEGQKSIDGGIIYQDGDVWIVYEWDEDNECDDE